MSVKTIFKTLIGTIAIIIISSVIVEFFNVSTVSMQLGQVSKMAAKQSCVLFTQETYKENNNGGAVRMPDIVAADNSYYVTGDFYGTGSAQAIWQRIYATQDFKNFCAMTVKTGSGTSTMKDSFPDLAVMQKASTLASGESIDNSDSDKAKAMMFKNNLYTTSNLGIPYLDKQITNRIFKWNLTKVLAGNNSASIQSDGSEHFVNYKGFRCYTAKAEITNYDYRVYNLATHEGKNEFESVTGLKVVDKDTAGNGIKIDLGDTENRNYFVTVVGIEYKMPVSYQGITPLKNIFDYVWRTEVKGLSDEEVVAKTGNSPWAGYNEQDMTSGGLEGNSDSSLNTTGKLIYTLIR